MYNKYGDIMNRKSNFFAILMTLFLTSCDKLPFFTSSSSEVSMSSSISVSSSSDIVSDNPKMKMLVEMDNNDEDLDVMFLQLENASSSKQTGDAVYIAIGNIDIIIDAGTKSIGTNAVVPFLKEHVKDNKIELVIATHTDADHIGGLVGNKKNGVYSGVFNMGMSIENIVDCGYIANTALFDEYKGLLDSWIEKGCNYYSYADMILNENTPNSFYLGKDTTLTILDTKMYDFSSSDTNDYSVPFLLQHGNIRYLLTGDCEKKAEANLTKLNIGEVDVFKAAHHGSPTSNTEQFLDTIMPKNVIVCSSYTNSYNLPKKDIIDRIANKYTKNIYGTFINGTIHATSNKEELHLWCEGYKNYITGNGEIDEATKNLIPIQDSYWYENVGIYAPA